MTCTDQIDQQGNLVVICDSCDRNDKECQLWHREDGDICADCAAQQGIKLTNPLTCECGKPKYPGEDYCSDCLLSEIDAALYEEALRVEQRYLLNNPGIALARKIQAHLSIYQN